MNLRATHRHAVLWVVSAGLALWLAACGGGDDGDVRHEHLRTRDP